MKTTYNRTGETSRNKQNHSIHANTNYNHSARRSSQRSFKNIPAHPEPAHPWEPNDESSIVSHYPTIIDKMLSNQSSLKTLAEDDVLQGINISKQADHPVSILQKTQSIAPYRQQQHRPIVPTGLNNYVSGSKKQMKTLKTILGEKEIITASSISNIIDQNKHKYTSELELLKSRNAKLEKENKVLKAKLEQEAMPERTRKFGDNYPKSQGIIPADVISIESINKLEESNHILQTKLNLSKNNEKQIREKYQRLLQEVSSHNETGKTSRVTNNSIKSQTLKYSDVLEYNPDDIFSVSVAYKKSIKEAKNPSIDSLLQLLRKYFTDFEETVLKIGLLVDSVDEHVKETEKYMQAKDLSNLLRIPLLYKNQPKFIEMLTSRNPKLSPNYLSNMVEQSTTNSIVENYQPEGMVQKRANSQPKLNNSNYNTSQQASNSKSAKVKNYATSSESSPIDSFAPEFLSCEQTLKLLNQILQRVVTSQDMIRRCKESKLFVTLLKKI